MKFLTGLCQDDVITSSGDVISRKKLHSHVRDKILGKVTEGIFKICYGSGVIQQKVGLGVNLPPLVLCVLNCVPLYTDAYTDSLLATCLISARLPQSTLIWDHLWHSNGRCQSPGRKPRRYVRVDSILLRPLPGMHSQCICATLNFRWIVSKLNWKLTFFLTHLGYIYHLILFVVRANAIIYKLARVNVWIELNWI